MNILLTAVVLLSSACFAACISTRKPSAATEKLSGKDSIRQADSTFVPTHPPVVIKRSWRDAK